MSLLDQRIAVSDWHNVAKMTGCSVTAARERYMPTDVRLAVEAQKIRDAAEAQEEAKAEVFRSARAAMFRERSRRRRALAVTRAAEKIAWLALIDKRLWAMGWDRTDLALAIGTTRGILSTCFAPSGHLTPTRRARIMEVIGLTEDGLQPSLSEHMAGAGE